MARTRASETAAKSNGHTNGYGAVNGNGHTKAEGEEAVEITKVRKPMLSERTDYSRWRLLNERGRHTWHYLEDEEDAQDWPQTTADKYFLGLPTVCVPQSLR